ncbi:MAG TPA: hypothetical protein VMS78_13655 [Rhizomicrobium sp.]|nr:hypothetical protein [Rhizomicrobium sp.]
MATLSHFPVMAALEAATHPARVGAPVILSLADARVMDGRVKPAHDDLVFSSHTVAGCS